MTAMLRVILALLLGQCSAAGAASGVSDMDVGGSQLPSSAHRIVPDASPRPLTPRVEVAREALESFTDGFVAERAATSPFAGMVVAVVKDGALLFSKGYGYADVSQRIPVAPAETLFRIGSVSKLFTATAAMQLVEQRKFELDRDVNAYLRDFSVADTYPLPVTLRHLLTHTAGFEQRGATAIFVDDASKLVPLSESLRRHLPARVWPADGATTAPRAAYSNWGMAAAGRMVELSSGASFDDYVERNIFAPLEMHSSTFREPLPAGLSAKLSKGYSAGAGALTEQPFTFVHNFAPAGSMSSTAHDMANFMIAQLQDGRFGESRILQECTARLMHSRIFSPNPYLDGAGLGFYETYLNGHRLVGHGGAALQFFAQLALLPEKNIGVFVAINTGGGGAEEIPLQFIQAFMEEYFPAELPAVSPPSNGTSMSDYAGTYRSTRRSFTTNEKLVTSMRGEIVVTSPEPGMLSVARRGRSVRYVEVAPAVFRRVDSGEMVAFTRDGDSSVTGMLGPSPAESANKLQWYETTRAWLIALVISAVVMSTAIATALWAWRADQTGPVLAQVARKNLALLALFHVTFLILLWVTFSRESRELTFNWRSPLFSSILVLPPLAIALTALAAGLGVFVWRERSWTLAARLHYSIAVGASALIAWILNALNLVGYKF
jgi:CubicO group peptidase (beta-lactamase class C family)